MSMFKRPKLSDIGWFYLMLLIILLAIVVAVMCSGCSGIKLFEFEDEKKAAEELRMSADKQLLEKMRPHIEVDLPRLKGFVEFLYAENRITEEEYMPIAIGFSDYEVNIAALLLDLRDVEAAKGLLDTLSQWTSVSGIIELMRGGADMADPVTLGRLAAMEEIARAQGVTIAQMSADMAAMRRLIEDLRPVGLMEDPRSTEELERLRFALDEVLRLRGEK